MPKIYVLVHNIRSLYNVGSIFRTADAANVNKIFLTGYTGQPPQKEIIKTAIGAEEYVSWEYHQNPVDVLKNLKTEGVQIVSLEQTDQSIDYRKFKTNLPICLILGHEVSGVPSDLLDLSDACIELPMHGKKQSLNVSVAFGIAIYKLTE